MDKEWIDDQRKVIQAQRERALMNLGATEGYLQALTELEQKVAEDLLPVKDGKEAIKK